MVEGRGFEPPRPFGIRWAEFGPRCPLFGPRRSYHAEENWLGAGFGCSGSSPISFFRYVHARNLGDIERQPNVCGSNIPLLGGRSVINVVYFRGIRLFFNDCARNLANLRWDLSSLAAIAEEALQYDRRSSRRQLWRPLPRHAGRVRFSLDGGRGSEARAPARLS
jgi:hypothetical protein